MQYAHQRLTIHRDIKPGNILVTSDGIPKLLDFGIAKILDASAAQELGPSTTLFQVLTPGYASPEQIKGEPITTATDVYSLGVVLYELLTGQHPYFAAGDTAEKIARKVCDTEPKKPSSVVLGINTSSRSPVSASDDGSSGQAAKAEKKLRKRLSGDLDKIVLRAACARNRSDGTRRSNSLPRIFGVILKLCLSLRGKIRFLTGLPNLHVDTRLASLQRRSWWWRCLREWQSR